jgi:SAM-dependent methyltransferase
MSYYIESLSGKRLLEVYEIAPPRVKQYLDAEIQFVRARLKPGDTVLELGCGYGRVALELAKVASKVVGIDTSEESLELGRRIAEPSVQCEFLLMDALDLKFGDAGFDVVVCVQNGICAFRVDQLRLFREALRVTRPGGLVIFSSYSQRFWPHRLDWFRLQSERRLVGEIDEELTRDGVIVCKDGFKAGAFGPEEFRALCARVGATSRITEVDESSIFCEVTAQ